MAVGSPSPAANGAVNMYTLAAGVATAAGAPFNASTPAAADRFGTAVALSANGSSLVIGATKAAFAAGQITVYKTVDSWATSLIPDVYTATGVAGGHELGISVAISADGQTWAGGSVGGNYVYVGGPTLSTRLYATNSVAIAGGGNPQFGASVSLSPNGNLLAVGAPFEDAGSNAAAGGIWLYARNGGGFLETPVIYSSTPAAADAMGTCVAVTDSVDSATLVGGGVQAWIFT
jgi:hypothetical protein